MGSHYVAQTSLKFFTAGHPPVSVFQEAWTTGLCYYHAHPIIKIFNKLPKGAEEVAQKLKAVLSTHTEWLTTTL